MNTTVTNAQSPPGSKATKATGAIKRPASKDSNISSAKKARKEPASHPSTTVQETVEIIPRISMKLTLAMLKGEAVCRGFISKQLPKAKADLLDFLVDGSIHLKETQAWKQVQALKAQMQTERESLLEKSSVNRQEEEREKQESDTKKRIKKQELDTKKRSKEVELQKTLHKHEFPMAHPHPLAHTSDLKQNGKPRIAACNCCRDVFCISTIAFRTCESCDFDICRACFNEKNMSPEEREEALAKQRKEGEKQLKIQARYRQQREIEEKQRDKEIEEEENQKEIEYDANRQFKKSIIRPPAKNKTINGNKMKGFTVWCSTGYGNDRWHAYNGPPPQEFDSTWKTAEDANARARYLFSWKNIWEMYPDELLETGECDEFDTNGLWTYTTEPPDSERWTVGVVPDVAFQHLPDARTARHCHDDESEPKGYSGGASSDFVGNMGYCGY